MGHRRGGRSVGKYHHRLEISSPGGMRRVEGRVGDSSTKKLGKEMGPLTRKLCVAGVLKSTEYRIRDEDFGWTY